MGLMNEVNQIDENFSYLSDDNKVSLLLYGDSRFDGNKNNFILSASITYILETKIFHFPYPKWCLNVHFSLTLIALFISSDTFHFKLFCLVILFSLGFTFPFLVTKYQLGHCWMYYILDFCSLRRSFCRKKKKIASLTFIFIYILMILFEKSNIATIPMSKLKTLIVNRRDLK